MKKLMLCGTIALIAVGVDACAPTPLEMDYGTSVRQMIAGQTADPRAAKQANAAVVKGEDPAVIEQALKSMRTEKAARAQVDQPMAIDLGGQGSP